MEKRREAGAAGPSFFGFPAKKARLPAGLSLVPGKTEFRSLSGKL